MRLFSEVREDIRLARLNNPFYATIFSILDVISIAFKLVLLAAFGLGIWHLVYGLKQTGPDNYASVDSERVLIEDKLDISVGKYADDEPVVAALTPERVERLKRFAQANRAETPVDREQTDLKQADLQVGVASEVASDSGAAVTGVPVIGTISRQGNVASLEKPSVSDSDASPAALTVTQGKPEAGSDTAVVVSVSEDLLIAEQAAVEISAKATYDQEVAGTVAPTGFVTGGYEGPWLLSLDPESYTIQISSTVNRPFLVTFARLLPEDQPYAIFHYMFRDRPEYGLSYGVFSTAEEAAVALSGLSQKVRRYGAFVRKVSIVQTQINRLSTTVSASK